MTLRQPIWPRRLSSPVVIGLATLGPIGRRLPAPGTWGSLAGLLYFAVFFLYGYGPGEAAWVNTVDIILASAAMGYVAVGFCGEAEARIGRTDPGEVILDEFVAMPLCFLGWGYLVGPLPLWAILLLGFALFRLFDITKPFFISKLQDLPAGWGIVVDDTAAALAACLTLHLAHGAWLLAQR